MEPVSQDGHRMAWPPSPQVSEPIHLESPARETKLETKTERSINNEMYLIRFLESREALTALQSFR